MKLTGMVYGKREDLDEALTQAIAEVNCITPVVVILDDQTIALFKPSFIFFSREDLLEYMEAYHRFYSTDRWEILPELSDEEFIDSILDLLVNADTIQFKRVRETDGTD